MDVGQFPYDFGVESLEHNSGEGTASWDALPPTYIGSTSSLAQPEIPSSIPAHDGFHDMIDFDFNAASAFTPGFDLPSSTTPEVLAAASALTQNVSHVLQKDFQQREFPRSGGSKYVAHPSYFSNQPKAPHQRDPRYGRHDSYGHEAPRDYGTVPPGSYMNKSSVAMAEALPTAINQARFVGNVQPRNHLFNNLDRSQGTDSSLLEKNSNLVYGSDNNFGAHGFVPPPDQKTEEQIQEALLGTLQGLEPQTSAANTQPSSPILQKQKRHLDSVSSSLRPAQVLSNGAPPNGDEIEVPSSLLTQPRKRQKNKTKLSSLEGKVEGHGAERRDSTKVKAAGRKCPPPPKRKNKVRSESNASPTKRPSSHSDSQKIGRRNLSEAQKRENHIQSEKKRRDLIRLGYSQLSELVPSARGAGFTNRDVLDHGVEWLVGLMRGNEKLEKQLAQLRGDDFA